MRLHRRPLLLAAGALSSAVFIGLIPTAPAAADLTVAAAAVAADESQSVTTSTLAAAPDASRPAFNVTIYTVVQWPTGDHTVSAVGDYGPRSCWGCSGFHEGDDFNPGGGTPVAVVANGTVIQAGWLGALGQAVTVRHTINGVTTDTLYGHMQAGSLRVHQGQRVDRGTTLGLVGSTGASTGNHLHFEVHVGGAKVNPMPWLHSHVNDWMWP